MSDFVIQPATPGTRAIFIDGVLQKLIKDKKVKVYEDNINRLINAFRS